MEELARSPFYNFGYIVSLVLIIGYFSFFFIGDLIKICLEWIDDSDGWHKPFLRDKFIFDTSCSVDRAMTCIMISLVSLLACLVWPLLLFIAAIYFLMHFARYIKRLNKKLKSHVEDTKIHFKTP